MYAVIATGGKQYRVQPGETIKIEKLEGAKDQGAVTFDQVLLVADGTDVKVGAPTLPGVKVTGEVLVASGKGESSSSTSTAAGRATAGRTAIASSSPR